jgi:hypothetical protein
MPANGSDGQQLGRIGLEEIARIGFVAKPAREILGIKDRQHAIMPRRDKGIGGDRDQGEGALPLQRLGIAPVLPDRGDTERLALCARGCVAFSCRVLLIEARHGRDAAALAIGVAKHPMLGDRLGARMDRPHVRPTVRVVRNKAPIQTALDWKPRRRTPAEDELRLGRHAFAPAARPEAVAFFICVRRLGGGH